MKQTAIDKAIANLEAERAVLAMAIEKLRAQQATTTKRREKRAERMPKAKDAL